MSTEEQLREQNNVLNQRLDKAKQVFGQMKADMAKQQERIKELEEKLGSTGTEDGNHTAGLLEKIGTLEEQLKESQEKYDKLDAENTMLSTENDELTEKMANMNTEWSVDKLTLTDLTKEHKRCKDEMGKLEEKLEKSKQTIDELNRVVSECNDSMNDKDMQLAEMAHNIEQITSENQAIKQSCEQLSDKLRATEDELYEANNKLEEAGSNDSSLKEEIASYESKLEKARLSFAEQKDKICSMSEMIDNLTQEKNDLIVQLKEAIESIEQSKIDQDSIDQANEEIEVLKGKLKKAEDDLALNNESIEKAMDLVKQSEDKRKADAESFQNEIKRQGEFINKMMEEIKEPFSKIVEASENVNLMWSSFIRDNQPY